MIGHPARPGAVDPERFALFERLAIERLEIDTLRTRGRDHLDFHDVSVWALIDLMNAAPYEAGFAAGRSGS
jgi:hypothetical protein